MNLFLITLFALISFFSILIGFAVFHHFKKFSIPGDPFPRKVLSIFKIGSSILIFLSFIVLILLII